MQKDVIRILFAVLMCLAISIHALAQTRGQGRPAPPNMSGTFTFIPKTDLEAVMGPTRGDRPARVVRVGGGASMGAYILHYPPMNNPLPPSSFYHTEISELYYVIRGQGTALLGGELENPTWRPEKTISFRQVSGPGVAGTLKNYKTQRWGPGDIIIVPPGVPHTIGFRVTVHNYSLMVVVDPKSVLNLVATRAQSLVAAQAEAQQQHRLAPLRRNLVRPVCPEHSPSYRRRTSMPRWDRHGAIGPFASFRLATMPISVPSSSTMRP